MILIFLKHILLVPTFRSNFVEQCLHPDDGKEIVDYKDHQEHTGRGVWRGTELLGGGGGRGREEGGRREGKGGGRGITWLVEVPTVPLLPISHETVSSSETIWVQSAKK